MPLVNSLDCFRLTLLTFVLVTHQSWLAIAFQADGPHATNPGAAYSGGSHPSMPPDAYYDGYSDTQDATLAYGAGHTPSPHQAVYQPTGSYRQPTSICLLNDRLAIVSTRLSGELYGLDLQTLECNPLFVNRDRRWGKVVRLTDECFVVADEASDSVIVFAVQQAGSEAALQPLCELPTPGLPRGIAWWPEQGRLLVSGQWSQRLYQFATPPSLAKLDEWRALPAVDLPLCGGAVLALPRHHRILVMDAFGRDYVVLDEQGAEVLKHDQVYGHNIPALVAVDDEERVLFPHQLLNEFAQSMRGDITWGGLLSNNLRWLRTSRLLDPALRGAEIFSQSKFYPVGRTGDGAGDPTSLSLSRDGRLAVTLGGTSRVAVGHFADLDLQQFDTGRHPVDSCFTPDDQRLLVVNQFSDSLTIITLASQRVEHLSLGPLRAPTSQERGEQFFFDARFSHDGWMSCHSCHSQGHTNGQLNDNLTDGSFGSPKRIPSLLGQAETGPYSWEGKFQRLEEQVFHSLRSTMATDNAVPPQVVDDIAAYLRALVPPPSLLAARDAARRDDAARDDAARDDAARDDAARDDALAEQTLAVEAGGALFRSLGCADCHAGSTFTSPQVYDVGLTDERGTKLFNPPSLRGLSQRHSFFHDGKAKSLREVILLRQHPAPVELDERQTNDLMAFLQSL